MDLKIVFCDFIIFKSKNAYFWSKNKIWTFLLDANQKSSN